MSQIFIHQPNTYHYLSDPICDEPTSSPQSSPPLSPIEEFTVENACAACTQEFDETTRRHNCYLCTNGPETQFCHCCVEQCNNENCHNMCCIACNVVVQCDGGCGDMYCFECLNYCDNCEQSYCNECVDHLCHMTD